MANKFKNTEEFRVIRLFAKCVQSYVDEQIVLRKTRPYNHEVSKLGNSIAKKS